MSSPRRPGGIALPVIVILGTASVAAIVSVSFEGETPTLADRWASVGDPAAPPFAGGQSAARPDPGFSIDYENAPAIKDGERPAAAEGKPQELPFLGVLQPRATEPAGQRGADMRRNLAARRAVQPAERALPSEEPASDCAADCADATAFQPAIGSRSSIAELDVSLSETVPLAADDQAGLVDTSDETALLASDVAIAAIDAGAAEGLLADSQPTVLVEPAGELVASVPDLRDLDESATVPAEAPPAELGLASPRSTGGEEQVAAAFEQPEPAASAGEGPAVSDPGHTIPQHLSRIGERYAAAPVAEAATPDQGLVKRDDPAAARPAVGEATIAVGLGAGAGSTVIVQDDELVAIRLGELVSLLEERFDHPLYVWIKSSAAASKFVTAETLAAAGIRTSYDAERKQIVLSTTDD